MNKETLARAKELEEDIRQMEFALSYYKRGRWSHWGVNDRASSFHFEFCKDWSHRDADMQDLPTWLNGPLMEVVERELERCKTELDNLGNEKPSAAECVVENMKQLVKPLARWVSRHPTWVVARCRHRRNLSATLNMKRQTRASQYSNALAGSVAVCFVGALE